jgi:hypothetical protein
MNQVILAAAFLTIGAVHSAIAEEAPPPQPGGARAVEFFGANGRPLGAVTTIAGVTYYISADGATVATSTIVEGRRVYKSY